MLIHLEDEAPLNAIVNDQGIMLLICPECKRIWTGNLIPANHSIAYKETDLVSGISPDVIEVIRSAMNLNPRLLEEIGLTPNIIARLGL